MDSNCPHCGAERINCGGSTGYRNDACRIREAVAYLSKFTTPGSVTANHSIANRTIEILTGDVREYR